MSEAWEWLLAAVAVAAVATACLVAWLARLVARELLAPLEELAERSTAVERIKRLKVAQKKQEQ